jgi:hypothetical protein
VSTLPSQQPETVEASCYLTIEPVTSRYSGRDEKGRQILEKARVTAMTQARPQRMVRAGSVVTKVTLRIDTAALLPLLPEAVIHIGVGDVEVIEVEADNPDYPDEEGQG